MQHFASSFVLVFSLIASLASSAQAQTAPEAQPAAEPAPAANPAPAQPAPTPRPTLAVQIAELQQYVADSEAARQRELQANAPSWAIHVNPLNLVLNELFVGADLAVQDRLQLTAQASYFDAKVVATENVGISAGAGIRYYPLSNGYQGWYLSPVVSLRSMSSHNTVTDEHADVRLLIVSATSGRQWILGPVLLRAGLGLARLVNIGSSVANYNTPIEGWGVLLDGAIGVAFK